MFNPLIKSCIVIVLSANSFLFSQHDSTKSYNLEEITVQSGILIDAKPLSIVDKEVIVDSDAGNVSEISKRIPSVKLQNNSRGESLIYFRGSSPRQLTLFFDGVPLNIPWDNRIDLSLLPTSAIESIQITKGVPSIVYGANSIAGIVNIKSIDGKNNSRRLINFQLGENNYQNYSGYLADKIGRFNYVLSLSHLSSDNFKLSNSFAHIDNSGDLRTNSSLTSLNSFAKLGFAFSNNSNISISFSYKNSKKDVPYELDVKKPRFWKYPVWKHLSTIVNGTHSFSSGSNISYSLAITRFRMQIDQYKSNKYEEIDDSEINNDNILYGRFVYSSVLGKSALVKLSASGFATEHKEKFLSSEFIETKYSQNVLSTGVEFEFLKNRFSSKIGASVDAQITPQTGLHPAKDELVDYGLNALFEFKLSSAIDMQLSLGRKTRFPTLREMFSGALGKYIPNPDLKSEVAYSGVFGFDIKTQNTLSQLNVFLTYINDGILRTTINDNQFIRLNRDELRNYGIEFSTDFNIARIFNVNINASYLESFGKNKNGSFIDTLEYKPNLIINGGFDINITKQLNTLFEINYIGKEFGLSDGSNGFEELGNYVLLNSKISYLFNLTKKNKLKIYLRANNILDKLYYTQWGLPEAGRQFFAGVKFSF